MKGGSGVVRGKNDRMRGRGRLEAKMPMPQHINKVLKKKRNALL